MFLYKSTQFSAKIIVFQMAAAMCQALPSFYSEYCQKSLFISVSSDFYENYIVTNNFCVSTPNSYCSLENYKFHILLIGSSFDQILQRLGNFLFTYQIIDCLYTLYNYRFYSNVISSTGEVFNQLDSAVHHNLKWNSSLAYTMHILGIRKNAKCCKEKTVTQKIQTSLFMF